MYDKIKTQPVSSISRASFGMGCVGAVIGAASAAATNIPMVKNGELDRKQAVKIVLKESAGVGLAATAATAVVGTVAPRSGFFSILGFAAITVGAKMLWDKAAYLDKASLPMAKSEIEAEVEPKVKTKVKTDKQKQTVKKKTKNEKEK